MEIKLFINTKKPTISEFADQHGLVMEVYERDGCLINLSLNPGSRFYAHFSAAEVKDGPLLSGVYGDGSTTKNAILDYAKEISGKLLVVNSFTPNRREIQIPELSLIEV